MMLGVCIITTSWIVEETLKGGYESYDGMVLI